MEFIPLKVEPIEAFQLKIHKFLDGQGTDVSDSRLNRQSRKLDNQVIYSSLDTTRLRGKPLEIFHLPRVPPFSFSCGKNRNICLTANKIPFIRLQECLVLCRTSFRRSIVNGFAVGKILVFNL